MKLYENRFARAPPAGFARAPLAKRLQLQDALKRSRKWNQN